MNTYIHRVLKVGGIVICTAPNEEDLNAAKVMCPECGAIFHRMQHLSSFDQLRMRSLFESFSFVTLKVEITRLVPPGDRLKTYLKNMYRRVMGKTAPHLVYIGVKSQ